MLSLALLTLWLEHQVHLEDAQHPSLRRHDPDYIVNNFTSTTYTGSGDVEAVFSAAQMRHFPDDDSTEVTAPRVLQSKPQQARFTVRADRGTLAREGDEIFLYDNVVLVREAFGEQPEARMTTTFLHVLRDRGLALTDREVLFEEPGRSLQGRGMEYHNATRELFLRNDVRGSYEAKKP